MSFLDRWRTRTRPCWLVIAGTDGARALLAERVDGSRRQIKASRRFVALIEPEPGSEHTGEQDLARAASRISAGPVFVVYPDPEFAYVDRYERGEVVEDEAWSPDALVRHCGFAFGWLSANSDASAHAPKPRVPSFAPVHDELAVHGRSVNAWLDLMRHGDWTLVLEGRPVDDSLVDGLHRDEPAVRWVAIRLAAALGASQLGERAPPVRARLAQLEATDQDERIRKAATEALRDLDDEIPTTTRRVIT